MIDLEGKNITPPFSLPACGEGAGGEVSNHRTIFDKQLVSSLINFQVK